MTSTRKWALLTAAIAIVFASSVSAQAVLITFTVDEIGSGMGTTPINPSAADIGKYEAGSFLALSGNIAGSLSGTSFLVSAPFLALSAQLSRSANWVSRSAKRAISLFSIAAHSSERHASEIAGDRIVSVSSALLFCASFGRPFQSHIPAEVC